MKKLAVSTNNNFLSFYIILGSIEKHARRQIGRVSVMDTHIVQDHSR